MHGQHHGQHPAEHVHSIGKRVHERRTAAAAHAAALAARRQELDEEIAAGPDGPGSGDQR